jgi:gliding motility-associated-like protein
MKSYSLTFLFFLFLLKGLGQNIQEISHWYFNRNMGIDFSHGIPVEEHGRIAFTEASSSISDKNGNLLFYTDGVTVWNKQHQVMLNGTGLKGASSSTQGAIITQKPCSKKIFYIFTTTSEGGIDGLQYSEVDMRLNGGLGDVTYLKNVQLTTPIAEKLCVISHSNGKDLWLVSREPASNRFVSYLITEDGVNISPITSFAGGPIGGFGWDGVGYLKASLDGRMIISVNSNSSTVDILNFDTSTGNISDKFSFPFFHGYGAEFSPNGKLIYLASWISYEIFQYDLTQQTVSEFIASQKLIGTCNTMVVSLQLSPDKKNIYFGKYDRLSLGCIKKPDIPGIGCEFIETAVLLTGESCEGTLPTFQMNYHYNVKGCPHIEIPNIITPNGDAVNDIFQIKNTTQGQLVVIIANRWGNTIFSTDSYMNDWTGEKLPDGTYFYHIWDTDNEEIYIGFLEIIR